MEPQQSGALIDRPCNNCVALSLVNQNKPEIAVGTLVSLMIGAGLFWVELNLGHLFFVGLFTMASVCFLAVASYGLRRILRGESYWVFYGRDHEGRPLKRLHVHCQEPTLARKKSDLTARRYVASLLSGLDDALTAAKLGHAHPDIMEVDGPFLRLNTGWRAKSWFESCFSRAAWEIVHFRVTDKSVLELDIRAENDDWSRLRVDFDRALLMLYGGRGSQSTYSAVPLNPSSFYLRVADYPGLHARARYLKEAWEITRHHLFACGRAAVGTTVPASQLGQDIREIVNQAMQRLSVVIAYAPDIGNNLAQDITRYNQLAQAWDVKNGSPKKPARRARKKKEPAATQPAT